jgi:hypothetical protein
MAALLVCRSTTTAPGPAVHSSVAVPTADWLPTTLVGLSVTDVRPIGRTVSGACAE